MPQLFVLGGRDVGRSFEILSGAVLGRNPDCGVRLSDRSVSRTHARIERDGDRWFVVDLGSRNGVRLHSERIERAELGDRDEILLGELPLRFRLTESESSAALDPVPAKEAGLSGGVELEEEIELGRAPSETIEPQKLASELKRSEELTERDRERARLLAQAPRGGSILSTDLSQRPLWMRALAYLLVVAAMGGAFYGAFKLVAYVRGSL